MRTLVSRLKDLEKLGEQLKDKIAESQVTESAGLNLRDAGVAVADFILNFRKRFEEMSPEDRKIQVRRCVSRIVVDSERGVATAYIRRVPAALPAIEQIYQKRRALTTEVVSAQSSGDPIYRVQRD